MVRVLRFPPERARNPAIARMRCLECGAPPMIFVPQGGLVHAYCGPLCAAACGIAPWVDADLAERAAWRDRAELESEA